MRLLHAERCWVISVAWWMSRSRCLQSSFTVSIHLFLSLPCLVPCTYPWSVSFGYIVWSIFSTWPKYCISQCCMRVATFWSRPTLSHTSLFLVLPLRVTPAILLRHDMSNTRNLLSTQLTISVNNRLRRSHYVDNTWTDAKVKQKVVLIFEHIFNIWNPNISPRWGSLVVGAGKGSECGNRISGVNFYHVPQ